MKRSEIYLRRTGGLFVTRTDGSPKAVRKTRNENLEKREVLLVWGVSRRAQSGLLPAAPSPPSGPLRVV